MSYVTWQFDRYAFIPSTNSWSSTATTLTEIFDPILDVKLRDGKDSFSFKLVNFSGAYDNYFQPNDKITVSRVVNSTTIGTSDILMVGAIRNVPNSSTGTNNTLKIEGFNFSEMVAEALVYINPVNRTPPQILQDAISFVSLYNTNFKVTWASTNSSLNSTGGAFQTYTDGFYYVPLQRIIEIYSSDSTTHDGSYLYWVDNNNQFIWKHKNSGTDYTFNSTTDEHVTYKDSKDTKGVKNFIILKGGRDPANKAIQQVYRDYTSMSKNGIKFYYNVSSTISAENLNRQDIANPNAASKFPTAYPFTTQWKRIDTNVAITVNNDAEYVQAIREEVKRRLTLEAQKLAADTINGILKVDLGFVAGTKTWAMGDRVAVTIPKIGKTDYKLRVMEIQYTSDIDTYSLEEDTGTI